ncbi:amidohydrolase family protein [Lacipirellula parvula]|uniref:amidohydrolase family protein n=1 Tax=Lacipirellula parvula TaxID=2650471 RepID=UPI001260C9F4|nr:amidohydrolase family protein [Lacipirellula parvula]
MATVDAKPPAINPLLASAHRVEARDADLFERRLQTFVPPAAFDVHAHLYPLVATGVEASGDEADVGLAVYQNLMGQWMGALAPNSGLFFGMPRPSSDLEAINRFVAIEVASSNERRGLMLIRPQDDPIEVERALQEGGFSGFKVYHCFADRSPTMEAMLEEYLPDWAWEIANAQELVLMIHLVRAEALADEANRRSLERCLRAYPRAKVVLAHAARGFCAQHTLDGIDALVRFDNVYFDTSAICEPLAFAVILQRFGSTRLLFGSDFPVCMFRGRVVSVAEGFCWLAEQNLHGGEATQATPTLIGIESLLALQQAARLLRLKDGEVEQIFGQAARSLLGITAAPACG